MKSRQAVVDLVCSWEGRNESDGTHKYIVDIYNSFDGKFPRNIKMLYSWPWCACTWSALAIKLGYTDIMPIEISCEQLIKEAKKRKIWKEKDSYIPRPADGVLYDWDDNGKGDNTGFPDHVGTIIEVNETSGYMVVMEGNYKNAVKKRTISLNGRYIRGFITPKYEDNNVSEPAKLPGKSIETIAKEVIVGRWGDGENRRKNLEKHGYNYNDVQKAVNKILNGSAVNESKPKNNSKTVIATCSAKRFNGNLAGSYKTTADLYCRNDSGTNKKALCLIPKGTKVKCFGYYNVSGNAKWLYIECIVNGVKYTGFSHSGYLKK